MYILTTKLPTVYASAPIEFQHPSIEKISERGTKINSVTSWRFSDTGKKDAINVNFTTIFWYLLLGHLLPEREETEELRYGFKKTLKLAS